MASEYTEQDRANEGCCWDYPRQLCRGGGCLCDCHATTEQVLLSARATLRRQYDELQADNGRLLGRIAALEAEVKALREALEWYATESNYDVDDYDHEDVPGAMVNEDIRCSRCRLPGCGSYFEPDRGKRARAALAASGGGR